KMKTLCTILVLIMLDCTSITASAATMTLTPVISQVFDGSTGTPKGLPSSAAAGDLIEIDVHATMNGAISAQDLWVAIFNVQNNSPGVWAPFDLGSGKWMTPAVAFANLNPFGGGPYASFQSPQPSPQSHAQYDSNGASLGGLANHWQNGNGDLGA